MRPGLILTFVAMGAATYLTRAPLLLVLARRRLPDWLERSFAALPVALLTALAVPLALLSHGRLVGVGEPQVLGVILVAVVARRTGNLLVAVAGGVLLVAALRLLLG